MQVGCQGGQILGKCDAIWFTMHYAFLEKILSNWSKDVHRTWTHRPQKCSKACTAISQRYVCGASSAPPQLLSIQRWSPCICRQSTLYTMRWVQTVAYTNWLSCLVSQNLFHMYLAWRALRYHLLWQGIHFLHLKKKEAEKWKLQISE